jgi:hypothetical protein
MSAWARVCAKERAVHIDVKTAAAGRNDGSGTASGQTVRDGQRKIGERVARTAELAAAPSRDCFPAWLDGRHHKRQRRSGDTTWRTRMTATLARRPGATRGKGDDALTYGLRDQKVKAAVKKGLTRRRGRRRHW